MDGMDGMDSMDDDGMPPYSPLPGAALSLADEVQRRQQRRPAAAPGPAAFKRSSAARTPAGLLGALAPRGAVRGA